MLQSSGLITFANLNTEMGYPSTQLVSLNDPAMRGLAKKASGIISLADFYGKANRIPVTITIAATTTDYVLNPSKVSGYVAGLMDVTFVINSGVVIGSTSTASAGLTISGFTTGDTVSIFNNGYVVGRGGIGGNANDSAGTAGGLALSVSYATKITNNGTIGGGGGGGGAGSNNRVNMGSTQTPNYVNYTGGGGGGGAGYLVGTGGTGSGTSTSGSTTAGGSAGSGGYSNPGGGGGALGTAGTSSGGAGGAAGACTSGNSNITWLVTGTRAGALN